MNTKQIYVVVGLAVAVAMTVAGGVLQGRIAYRWGPSETMQTAAQKLDQVPQQFGGPKNDRWQLKSSQTMDQGTVEMLECTGNFVRTYENRRTGELVSVFVIIGRAGPIAVHTPEICYSAQNWKSRDQRQHVDIAGDQGQDDQFWALTFKTKTLREDLLRVYYAWGTGDRWSAPNDARWTFTGSPYLYKIQASSELPAGTDLKTGDACRDFLQDFVPVLRQYLVEAPKR